MVEGGFGATVLIPSWIAHTPGDSHVLVEVRGRETPWYRLGDWAFDDRTSIGGQEDSHGRVDADTFKASGPLSGWQVRITRIGPALVDNVYLLASGPFAQPPPSEPVRACGVVLDVPRYAQLLHDGGDSLCSPTSTAMVLAYWGVPADVAHAAKHTYDREYDGCGNWPFNTAYAGHFGVEAFVTRLRSLREAELFIEARIPLVVSASYRDGEVPGLGYQTDGHLMVLAGFTEAGDPVLIDPYAGSNDAVRKSVGRAEWEAAWQGTSGGITYVIHPTSVPLPPAPAQANW
jgi:hypothetical protein